MSQPKRIRIETRPQILRIDAIQNATNGQNPSKTNPKVWEERKSIKRSINSVQNSVDRLKEKTWYHFEVDIEVSFRVIEKNNGKIDCSAGNQNQAMIHKFQFSL